MGEDARAGLQTRRVNQKPHEVLTEEEVVAQDQCDGFAADEIGPNQKGLGNALGFGLDGVRELDAPLAAIT